MQALRQSGLFRLCAIALMALLLATGFEVANDRVHQHGGPGTALSLVDRLGHETPAPAGCEHCSHIAGMMQLCSSVITAPARCADVEPVPDTPGGDDHFLSPPTRPPIA